MSLKYQFFPNHVFAFYVMRLISHYISFLNPAESIWGLPETAHYYTHRCRFQLKTMRWLGFACTCDSTRALLQKRAIAKRNTNQQESPKPIAPGTCQIMLELEMHLALRFVVFLCRTQQKWMKHQKHDTSLVSDTRNSASSADNPARFSTSLLVRARNCTTQAQNPFETFLNSKAAKKHGYFGMAR